MRMHHVVYVIHRTTGNPKGVLYSHNQFIMVFGSSANGLGFTRSTPFTKGQCSMPGWGCHILELEWY